MAEAAMNSFRWANKMFVDHSALDKTLAEEVYQKHGDSVLRLASRFASLRSVTRTSLVCEAILIVAAPVAVAGTSIPVHAAPAAPAPAPKPVKPPIGNLGDDPYAYTEVDVHGIPKDYPRGAKPPKPIAKPRFDPLSVDSTLTPAEWMALFDQRWPK
jgi:hypothetical protein